MNDHGRKSDDRLLNAIALVMQGMAIWYLLFGIAALAFVTMMLLLGDGASGEADVFGVGTVSGAEMVGAGLGGAVVLSAFSWIIMGKAFLRPRWSLVLLPGLVGSITSQAFDLMGWPVPVLIGGFLAYCLIRARLEPKPSSEQTS